jgi:hypothetical protein
VSSHRVQWRQNSENNREFFGSQAVSAMVEIKSRSDFTALRANSLRDRIANPIHRYSEFIPVKQRIYRVGTGYRFEPQLSSPGLTGRSSNH